MLDCKKGRAFKTLPPQPHRETNIKTLLYGRRIVYHFFSCHSWRCLLVPAGVGNTHIFCLQLGGKKANSPSPVTFPSNSHPPRDPCNARSFSGGAFVFFLHPSGRESRYCCDFLPLPPCSTSSCQNTEQTSCLFSFRPTHLPPSRYRHHYLCRYLLAVLFALPLALLDSKY